MRYLSSLFKLPFSPNDAMLRWLWPEKADAPTVASATGENPSPRPEMPQIEPLIHEAEAVVETYRQSRAQSNEAGISDVLKGIPLGDASTPNASQQRIMNGADEAKASIHRLITDGRRQIEAAKDENTALAEETVSEAAEKRRAILVKMEAEQRAEANVQAIGLNAGLHATVLKERNATGVLKVLNEDLRDTIESYDQNELKYQKRLQTYHQGSEPTKRAIDTLPIYVTVFTLISSLEIMANFTAFQIIGIGGMNIAALILGCMVAVLQALAAKKTGASLYNGQSKAVKFYGGLSLLLCILLSSLRLQMEGGVFVIGIYMSLNVLIAIAAGWLGYAYEINREIFDLSRMRRKLSQRIAHLEHHIKRIAKALADDMQAFRLEAEADAEQHVKNLQRECEERARVLAKMEERLTNAQMHYDKRLDHECETALIRYADAYRNTRDKNHRNGRPGGMILSGVIGLVLLASACTEPMEPVTLEILVDETGSESPAPEAEAIAAFAMSYAGLDSSATRWGEVRVNISTLSEHITPVVKTVTLEPSQHFLFRNEKMHRRMVKAFHADLLTELQDVVVATPEQDHSRVYANLFARLQNLAKSPGRRGLLSFSDLFLNTESVDFYDYLDYPQGLVEQKDSLYTVMIGSKELRGVAGIELINVHHPPLEYDALYEATKSYFSVFFTGYGMQVRFLPQLPESYETEPVLTNRKLSNPVNQDAGP